MNYCSRRNFLKATGAIAGAACVSAGRLAAAPLKRPVGLQLYSVRNLLQKDFDGTLAKVRDAGYSIVEAAGYYDRTATEFRDSMDNAGLRCVSSHHTLLQLQTQLDQLIDYGHTAGFEYIVCATSTGVHRDSTLKGPPTLDDWRFIAGEFNRIGEKVKSAGITFGVHNHTPEFTTVDGVLVYDELLRLTDPKIVVFEMDAGWVYASEHNPVEYLAKEPERFQLMHLKDMVRDADGRVHLVAMGRGNMDYHAIMHASKNLKYYFIEQEEFDMDPFEEIREEAEYMKKLDI